MRKRAVVTQQQWSLSSSVIIFKPGENVNKVKGQCWMQLHTVQSTVEIQLAGGH